MGQKSNSSLLRIGIGHKEWLSKYEEKSLEESTLLIHNDLEIRNYLTRIFKLHRIFRFHHLLIHGCQASYSENSVNIIINYYIIQKKDEKKSLSKFNIKCFENSDEFKEFSYKMRVSLYLFLKPKYNQIIDIKFVNVNLNMQRLEQQSKNFKILMKKLRRFQRHFLFKKLVSIIFCIITHKNSAKLFSEFIANQLKLKKNKQHNYFLFFLKEVLSISIKSSFSNIRGIKLIINGRFNKAPRSRKKIIQLGSVPAQSFNSKIDFHQSISYTLNGTFGISLWICEKI